MKAVVTTIAVTCIVAACSYRSPGPDGPFPLGEVDEAPEFLACSRYEPPVHSAPRSTVTVYFDLSADGRVVNPQASAGPVARQNGLISRALSAARSCRYTPAYKDGRAVAVTGLTRNFVFNIVP